MTSAITESLARQVSELTAERDALRESQKFLHGERMEQMRRNAALIEALTKIKSYCIGYGGQMAGVIVGKVDAALAQEPPCQT